MFIYHFSIYHRHTLFLQKKHWNSFTTNYFLDASDVIDDLQANHAIRVDVARMKKLLDNELQCHECPHTFPTMPKLKQHLMTHIY